MTEEFYKQIFPQQLVQNIKRTITIWKIFFPKRYYILKKMWFDGKWGQLCYRDTKKMKSKNVKQLYKFYKKYDL